MALYLSKTMLSKLSYIKYPVSSIESCVPDDKTKNILQNGSSLSTEMICRVCTGKAFIPITSKINEIYDVIGAIRSISNVVISADDLMPKFICVRCLDQLKTALLFKKSCELSNEKFKKILDVNGHSSACSVPYKKHDFGFILHQIEKRKQKYQKLKLDQEELCLKFSNKHAKLKSFKCSSCGESFENKESLSEHAKVGCQHHDNVFDDSAADLDMTKQVYKAPRATHVCPDCGKVFSIKARLKNHMLLHTNTFHFYCDLCPYKCKYKYYLVMHMRTHTGEKPYRCAHCPASFVNPSNLNKHKLTHQEKQFKCLSCDKAFRTSSALREHHEVHHMNVKHTCTVCGRDFKYKTDLRKHEIKSHNRAKRSYVGGEPAYKTAERMKKETKKDEWICRENVQIAQPVPIQTYIEKGDYVLNAEPIYYGVDGILQSHLQTQQTHIQPQHIHIQTQPHQMHMQQIQPLQLQLQHATPIQAQHIVQPQTIQISLSDLELKKDEMKIYDGHPQPSIAFY